MAWLGRNSLIALTVQTWDGDWRLTFHGDPDGLEATGQFKSVRKL